MKTLLLALILGLPGGADLYPAPTPEIIAPDKPVRPGRNVRLRVNPIQNPPAQLQAVTYTWLVYPPVEDLEVDRLDGTRASFGSGEDEADYVVNVITTYTYVDFDKKTVNTKSVNAERIVLIRRTDPNPSPVPVPDPKPGPVVDPKPIVKPTFPPGQFGLAAPTYEAVLTVPIEPGKRAAQAVALAANYGKVVDTITSQGAAGQQVTPRSVIELTVSLNRDSLGSDITAWAPALTSIASLANSQKAKFQNLDDWKTAWTEIKTGLEAFKQ